MSRDIVLIYRDRILRQSDVDLLRGPHWLNDAIIGFYFEYLSKQYGNANFNLKFVCSEISQMLKLTDLPEYPIFLDPVDAKNNDFIFFPINDCNSKVSSGGSHWSLMIFSKNEKACFHLDSSHAMNSSVARDFSKKIMDYLLSGVKGQFFEVDCPQQDNGYDCGLFVLSFSNSISEQVLKLGKVALCNYEKIKKKVETKRFFLLTLVEGLRAMEED